MIRRGEIDYLCIKSAKVKSKEKEDILSEPDSELIPKEIAEKPKIPHDEYDFTFKVIIFGEPGVRKKGLAQRFLGNPFISDSKMTIGVDLKVKDIIIDGQNIKLEIWDFGGEERFRFLLPTYARGAKGGLFIYDIKDYSSLSQIDDWLTNIRKDIKEEAQFPIIMVGIMHEEENKRQISSEEAITIAKSRSIDGFVECDINTGENVEEAFEQLTRLMLENESEKLSEEISEISNLF